MLENKTIRIFQAQVKEMNARLPELIRSGKSKCDKKRNLKFLLVNESRDKLLDQMQTHHTDIKLMAAINRVQRESAVLVKVSKALLCTFMMTSLMSENFLTLNSV